MGNPFHPTIENSHLHKKYIPALDGLRGIAVIMVILFHFFTDVPLFRYGWSGVNLFFVLSGFLITDILLRTRRQHNYYIHFIIRRCLRIFPLYFLVIIMFFIAALFLYPLKGQFDYYMMHPFYVWLDLQNWLYIFHPRPGELLILGHFWSLSIENQYYFIWPVIVLLINNKKWLAIISMAIILSFICIRLYLFLVFTDTEKAFRIQYMTQLDGIAMGGLIAVWMHLYKNTWKNRTLFFAGIIIALHLILWAIIYLKHSTIPHFNIIGYTSLSAFFGILLIIALSPGMLVNQYIMQNKFLIYSGKISYGLYVWHWPVWVIMNLFILNNSTFFPDPASLVRYAFLAGGLILSFLISHISYNYFELKFLLLKNKFV